MEQTHICLPAATAALVDAQAFVEKMARMKGFSAREQTDLQLATEELFENIAHYAYDGDTGEVELRFSMEKDMATLVFIDSGKPFNPLENEDPKLGLPLEERQPGGLGIFLVRNCMDEMEYSRVDGKNILTIKKRRGVRPMRTKISRLVVVSVLIVFVASVLISVAGMLNMRQSVIASSKALGGKASEDSMRMLEEQTKLTLESVTKDKANDIDYILDTIIADTNIFADELTRLYARPDIYPAIPVEAPDPANAGKIVTQVLYADGLDPASVQGEVELVGNCKGLMEDILTELAVAREIQFGSEYDFFVQADADSHIKTDFFEPRSRLWYAQAKEAGTLIHTDTFEDAYDRGLNIVFARPVYGANGQLAGVASIGAMITDLEEYVLTVKEGAFGYIFVVDESGKVIIAPANEKLGTEDLRQMNLLEHENAGLRAAAGEMVAGGNGISAFEAEGREYYIAYEPMTTVSWSVGVITETDTLMGPALQAQEAILGATDVAVAQINRHILTTIVVFVVLVALCLLGAIYYSRRVARQLTRPVQALVENTREVGGGSLVTHPVIETGDEIEVLSRSFNTMVDQLRAHTENLTRVTAEKERIATELNIARQIQGSMLPCIFPPYPDREEFDLYARMVPAEEVGGDFYDFFLIDEDHLALVIADVSDKGVPAALFMVITKTLLKNHLLAGFSPGQALAETSSQLCENNEAGMFVTAFVAVWEVSTGRLTYANAGHNPPLVAKDGKGYLPLAVSPGFVLAGLPDICFEEGQMSLLSGDSLFLYTDGVTEAANPRGELYSEGRLLAFLNGPRGPSKGLADILDKLNGELIAFAEGANQADDITMLLLEIR